jgi:hypothetical protein
MTDLTLLSVFLGQETAPVFSDESDRLTAAYKQRLLEDWRRFLFSGFKKRRSPAFRAALLTALGAAAAVIAAARTAKPTAVPTATLDPTGEAAELILETA